MVMTDPIADMLTRIRNANELKYTTVEMPGSKEKAAFLEVLKNEGFIADYVVTTENGKSTIKVTLKYSQTKERVIKGLKRISKPGLRVYATVEDLPKVLNGLGIAVISTSKGIMTDKQARKENIGGEVLCYIY